MPNPSRLEIIKGNDQLGGSEQLKYLGNEYPSIMASHIAEACVRQGLNVEFVPGFMQHMRDMHLVVREDVNHPNAAPSFIAVSYVKTPGSKEPSWQRLFVLSQHEIIEREKQLEKVMGSRGIELDSQRLQSASIDWILYENVVAVLGNACYMQSNFPNGYINDFHGQSPYYLTERQMSAEYLQDAGVTDISIEEDYQAFKEGFGLMLLHETLLRKGIVSKAKLADWMIEELRRLYPRSHRGDIIRHHLEAVRPDHGVRQRIAELALEVFDPDLDLDEH